MGIRRQSEVLSVQDLAQNCYFVPEYCSRFPIALFFPLSSTWLLQTLEVEFLLAIGAVAGSVGVWAFDRGPDLLDGIEAALIATWAVACDFTPIFGGSHVGLPERPCSTLIGARVVN